MKRGIRISAGRLRGRRLPIPVGVRPTAGRVREALVDIWSHRLTRARFLDLFAGSGSVGLEALSRGAGFVVFVEADRKFCNRLQDTCTRLAPAETAVLHLELPREIGKLGDLVDGSFDLIFADPPYGFDEFPTLIRALDRYLRGPGEIALEHAASLELGEEVGELVRFDSRSYGDSALTFYRRRAE